MVSRAWGLGSGVWDEESHFVRLIQDIEEAMSPRRRPEQRCKRYEPRLPYPWRVVAQHALTHIQRNFNQFLRRRAENRPPEGIRRPPLFGGNRLPEGIRRTPLFGGIGGVPLAGCGQ